MPTIAQTTKEKRLISELFSEDDTRLKKQRVRFDDYVEVLTEDDDDEELDGIEEEEEEDVEFVLSIGEDGDFDYTIITTTATTSVAAAASASNHQPSQQDIKKSYPPSNQENIAKITRPASPFAGSDRRLCEELYIPPASYSSEDGDCCPCCEGILNMMTLPSLCSSSSSSRSSVTSWQNSLGNNLKIFIPSTPPSSSRDEDDDAAASSTAVAGEAKSPLLLRDVALLTPLITPPLSPRREGKFADDGLMATADETIICEWPCNLTVDNAITSALELSL